VKLERLATPTVSEPDEKGPADEIPGLEGGRRRSRRRVANVYDAVAGTFLLSTATDGTLTDHLPRSHISPERHPDRGPRKQNPFTWHNKALSSRHASWTR